MENNSYEPEYSRGKSGVPPTTQPAFSSHTSSSVGENRALPPPFDAPYPNPYPDNIHAAAPHGQPYYPQPGPGYAGPVFVDSQEREQPPQVTYLGQQSLVTVAMVPVAPVSMVAAIVLSCFSYFFCGAICGGIAFILAMVGQSSAAAGDTRSAIQLRNASYGLSIAGIVSGIIIIAIVAGIYGSVVSKAYRSTPSRCHNYYYNYYYDC